MPGGLGLCLLVLFDNEVQGVSFMEKEWSEQIGVDRTVRPMLAQDVGRVHVSSNVMESNHLGGDRFSYIVVGEGLMALAQPRMWDGPTSGN